MIITVTATRIIVAVIVGIIAGLLHGIFITYSGLYDSNNVGAGSRRTEMYAKTNATVIGGPDVKEYSDSEIVFEINQ